ncbi:MAG: OsmC family protein [Woeseia sp.]
MSTLEELLAASQASCYGIGVRSLIGRRGGRARRITVDATITAEKGSGGIRIQSSHLSASAEALEGLDDTELADAAHEVADECPISLALRGAVRITHEITDKSGDQASRVASTSAPIYAIAIRSRVAIHPSAG